MTEDQATDPNAPPPTAQALRMKLLEQEMQALENEQRAKQAEQEKHAEQARAFLEDHVTDKEREMIRKGVLKAVENGKMQALIYSFPSSLCTDSGRKINNGDPDWPDTLQGKARELFERYRDVARPAGYRLKAAILNFPGGMPGDVGFFLSWDQEA
jgi:hypothetical protein